MNTRDEDQSEDGPFGTPRSSSNDGTTSNNNEPSTPTTQYLPAIPIPSDILTDLDPRLISSPVKGLDQDAIIGIIIAVVVAILFILGVIDILLRSSRVQKALSKKTFRFLKYRERPPSRFPELKWNTKFDAKPLPTIPDPAYFSKDIRPSEKRYTFNSGYSSRYSRFMSFDSGIGLGGDGVEGHSLDMILHSAESYGSYRPQRNPMTHIAPKVIL